MFTPDQVKALEADLNSAHVATRSQSGRSLSYIEGWHAIKEANRIFGFHAWARTTESVTMVDQREVALKSGAGFTVSYVARVRVQVVTETGEVVIRDGTGAGHGKDKDLGLAHESAIKEAETDAMKRALMTFGNPFGLALYDKTQANVSSIDRPAIEQFEAELKLCKDEVAINSLLKDFNTPLLGLREEDPAEFRVLHAKVQAKKREVSNGD